MGRGRDSIDVSSPCDSSKIVQPSLGSFNERDRGGEGREREREPPPTRKSHPFIRVLESPRSMRTRSKASRFSPIPSPGKYRRYTSWGIRTRLTRTRSSSCRRCDKTWSLSRTDPRRVCLSFFVYTFRKSAWSAWAADSSLSLPLSLSSASVYGMLSLPHRGAEAFLSSTLSAASPSDRSAASRAPQAPSSSSDTPSSASRMSSGGARIVRQGVFVAPTPSTKWRVVSLF